MVEISAPGGYTVTGATEEIKGKSEFIGPSDNEKPKPDGLGAGSTLHLVDTGEEYIFHNDMWVPDSRLETALRRILGAI